MFEKNNVEINASKIKHLSLSMNWESHEKFSNNLTIISNPLQINKKKKNNSGVLIGNFPYLMHI